jgi:hypothetical protein
VEFQKAKQASDAKKERDNELARLRAIAEKAETKAPNEATPPIGHNSGEDKPFWVDPVVTTPPLSNSTVNPNDAFAGFGTAPTPKVDPTRQPNVTVTIHDYDRGFEACKIAVLAIMNDPTPRKRADFIQAFNELKPNKQS